MKSKLIMSSGPTQLSELTKLNLVDNYTNQDLDSSFKLIYRQTIDLYNELIGNKNGETIIMTGEAMLALEAACLNFIEKGDKVLVVSNGIFGAGFEGLAQEKGADTTVLSYDWKKGFPVYQILEEVKKDDYKVVTMVHVETPTGVVNDVASLCRELRDMGIISIVDSVSAIGGQTLDFDNDCIDVLLGGSQKCLSLPADLSFVSLSKNAIHYLENRSPVKSFYLNLLSYVNALRESRFLYTQCMGSILALNAGLKAMLDTDFVSIHEKYAAMVRYELIKRGFKIYAESDFANTVTSAYPPDGITANELFDGLIVDKDIVISGGLGELNGKIIRIGHMGENNKDENFEKLFQAIDELLYK